MKIFKHALLPLAATAALAVSAQSHAVTSVNNNGNMLVTMDNTDSTVIIASYLSTSGTCPDGVGGGYWTAVLTWEGPGFDAFEIDRYCDVNNVRVAGLSGKHIVSLNNVNIPGKMDVRGGPENDTVRLRGDNNFGQLSITLRGGNNKIQGARKAEFIFPASNSVNVNTHVDIDTNNGNDVARFKGLNAGGTADINLGGGDDTSVIRANSSFNKLFLRLGGGENSATVKNVLANLVQVFGGGNADDVYLKNVTATNDVDIITSGGDDIVEVENVNAGNNADANGGNGTDCIIDNGFAGGSSTGIINFEPCEVE